MKYKTIAAFMKAAQAGELADVVVIVDNDEMKAYNKHDTCVCDFEDQVPQRALFGIFMALGVNAELP
jgi:hypothetical protein